MNKLGVAKRALGRLLRPEAEAELPLDVYFLQRRGGFGRWQPRFDFRQLPESVNQPGLVGLPLVHCEEGACQRSFLCR